MQVHVFDAFRDQPKYALAKKTGPQEAIWSPSGEFPAQISLQVRVLDAFRNQPKNTLALKSATITKNTVCEEIIRQYEFHVFKEASLSSPPSRSTGLKNNYHIATKALHNNNNN